MVDNGASGHYFDDAVIRNLEHRLQDYVHLATPRKIITAGGALLDGTAAGVLQGVITDDYGNQILNRVDVVMMPGIGCNLFSVMTSAKKVIATIFDYENPRLEGINVTVPLRSESVNLYTFVLDLSAEGYGDKELARNAVANAQVWHRWLELCRGDHHRRVEGERRPKQGDFRQPPCWLQREGGPLSATTGFLGPTLSRSVLPWSRRVFGDDLSQKGNCNRLRLRKSQDGGNLRHRAATKRVRQPLRVRAGLECERIW